MDGAHAQVIAIVEDDTSLASIPHQSPVIAWIPGRGVCICLYTRLDRYHLTSEHDRFRAASPRTCSSAQPSAETHDSVCARRHCGPPIGIFRYVTGAGTLARGVL